MRLDSNCHSTYVVVRSSCMDPRRDTPLEWRDMVTHPVLERISYNFLRSSMTDLPVCDMPDLITRRQHSVFGHIARLPEDVPAHQALRCRVDLTLGHLPDQSWKRRPGHPDNRLIDQLHRDNNNMPPADLWRRSTTHGHMRVTLRSSTTTLWRRQYAFYFFFFLIFFISLPYIYCCSIIMVYFM